MPDIIEINDSDAVVRSKIIAILEFDGISTDDITSWGIATNRLNLAANRLGFNNITNNMPGSEARAIINQLAVSPAPVYPENTVLPAISGNARYNQTLTATTGTWNGYPAPTYSYQWQADGIPIPGATSSTYLIKESDLGKQIRVGVTATNLSGPASVFSNPTAAVTSTPINSSLPTISGTAANGQTLTANNGTWIAFPVPAFTYQWKADGVDIAGATNQTLALGNNQIGREITVAVTATNSEGFDTKTTNATARVTSAPINTVLPLVAAEIVEGKAVTTTSGTWLGYPVPTYAYQWKRNGTNISGATSSSYTPVSADVGQNITVTVTATNSVSAVQATSVAKMAKPAWAETFDAWRNFATNVGDLPNPEDIHPSNILAPETSGNYQTFAPNILTRTDLGLQTVPTRTNPVRNSSAFGATSGSPGTLPTNWGVQGTFTGINREIVNVGTSNGLPFIDFRLFGTASVAASLALQFETSNSIAASSGQTWSGSIFASVTSGSLDNLTINFRPARAYANGATSEALQTNITSLLDSSMKRFSHTVTLTDSNITHIAPQLLFNVGNGNSVDVTIRIWCPQTEQAIFSSSPILTTGSSSTVTGNRQFISGLGSQLANGVAGFIQYNQLALGAEFDRILTFTDGTTNNRLSVVFDAGSANAFFEIVINSVIYRVTAPARNAIGMQTWAFGAGAGFGAARWVGGSQVNVSPTPPNMPPLDRLGIGGIGLNATRNVYQFTRKLALDYLAPGDDPATKFNEAFVKAQLAAAAP